MPYEITQCYLPPGRGDFPAFTPAEADTRFSDPGGRRRYKFAFTFIDQRQVWFILLADWTRDMQVKLWDPLRTRAIPERLRGVSRRGAIQIHVYLYLYYQVAWPIHVQVKDAILVYTAKRLKTAKRSVNVYMKTTACTPMYACTKLGLFLVRNLWWVSALYNCALAAVIMYRLLQV